MTLEVFEEIYKTQAELIESKAGEFEGKNMLAVVVVQAEVDDELFEKFGFEDLVIRRASSEFGTQGGCKEFTRRINAATKKMVDVVKALPSN